MSYLFSLCGWESLARLVDEEKQQDADWVYAFVHWFLVYKMRFGCLGLALTEQEILFAEAPPVWSTYSDTSELLPADWTLARNLRYMRDGDRSIYTLQAKPFGDMLHVYLINSSTEERLAAVQFHTENAAAAIRSARAAKWATDELQPMLQCLLAGLLDPVFGPCFAENWSQTYALSDAALPNPHTTSLGCDPRPFCDVRLPAAAAARPEPAVQLGSRGVPHQVAAGDRREVIGAPPHVIVVRHCKRC